MTTPPGDRGRDKCGADKRQGEGQCGRPAGWGTPHPGVGRCKLHGGSTASHVEAAQQAQAQVLLEKALWSGLANALPVTDPVSSLERLAGALQQLVDEAGRRVNELSHLAGGEHLTQLRAEVGLLERALVLLRGVLVDMARLGIDNRRLEMDQVVASVVVAAVGAGLDAAGLDSGQRDLFLAAFLPAIGRPDGVLGDDGPVVVVGEVES
jgi:hypothetical protein